MTAASRQSGVEGTDGSVGLKVMPIDSVTISDSHDPGERADADLDGLRLSGDAERDHAYQTVRAGVVTCPRGRSR
jgi:hypothetical protein